MFENLTNEGMLDRMLLDWSIFTLRYQHYPNRTYLWERWIRE